MKLKIDVGYKDFSQGDIQKPYANIEIEITLDELHFFKEEDLYTYDVLTRAIQLACVEGGKGVQIY